MNKPYRLYAHKNSYAMGTHLLLEELHLDYEVKWFNVHKPEEFPEEFLTLNPNGRVPVLLTKDGPIYESAATLVYLAENHENKFLPSELGRERASAQQWLFYLMSTLQPEVLIQFNPEKYYPEDVEQQNRLKQASLSQLDKIWRIIENALTSGPYFLGNNYSICDMLFVMQAIWQENQPSNLPSLPRCLDLMQNVLERPATKKILQVHGIEHLADLPGKLS